mgnify:FL=1
MAELQGLEFLKANEIKDEKCNLEVPFAFISYAHDEQDTKVVRNVFDELYKQGYNLWIDTANIPKDENSWRVAAQKALRYPEMTCKIALFFRSESSLISPNVLKELEMIKKLKHIARIVVIDIWQNPEMDADKYEDLLLNDLEDDDKYSICDKIYETVDKDSNAIRTKDIGNELKALVNEVAEQLKIAGIKPRKLETKKSSDTTTDPASDTTTDSDDCITGPVDLNGGKGSTGGRSKGNFYNFDLYGKQYTGKILKEMMLTVFKTVMYRHPDKLDQLLAEVLCLGEGVKIARDTKPSLFRAGEVIEISGRQIAIGTSLDERAVRKYIDKLIMAAGEQKSIFNLGEKKAKE